MLAKITIKFCIAITLGVLAPLTAAHAATLAATYQFENSFNSDVGGTPALTPVNPLNLSSFQQDTVFGQARTVYRFDGSAIPATDQGGFSLNASGLITANSYSVGMIFKLDGTEGYRRIIDVADRASDNGFYVDPSSHLVIYPVVGNGPNLFNTGYHDVIMTVTSDGIVKGYIDGLTDFTTSATTVMNLDNSSSFLMNFFLDNAAADKTPNEYSSGSIAQLRIYDGVLTDAEALAAFQNPSLVPEPSVATLLVLSGVMTLVWRLDRRRRSVNIPQ